MKLLNYIGSHPSTGYINDQLHRLNLQNMTGNDVLIESIIQEYEALRDTTRLFVENPILYMHLQFFNPLKYTAWREISPLDCLTIAGEYNVTHLYGMMLASKQDSISNCRPLTHLHYCYDELYYLSNSEYFESLRDIKYFSYSTMIGISHAHISHIISALKLIESYEGFKVNVFVDRKSCLNYQHIEYAIKNLMLNVTYTDDVFGGGVQASELQYLAKYGDRAAFLASNLIFGGLTESSKYYNILHTRGVAFYSDDMLVKRPVFESSFSPSKSIAEATSTKSATILLHNRDAAFKSQHNLAYRDSNIDILAKATDTIFSSQDIKRIGYAGVPISHSPRIADLAGLRIPYNEPAIMQKSNMLISTTSGPGHFCSELYGIPTILVNGTSLVTGDVVACKKVLGLRYIDPESVTKLTVKDFAYMLIKYWSNATFSHREMEYDEIRFGLDCIFEGASVFCLRDLDDIFYKLLGSISLQPLFPPTYHNLKECLNKCSPK